MKKNMENIIKANDGQIFVRKNDEFIMGTTIVLGKNDTIDNYVQRDCTEEEMKVYYKQKEVYQKHINEIKERVKAREEEIKKAREERAKAREEEIKKAREERIKAREERIKGREERIKAREEEIKKAREERVKAREEKQ